MLSINFINDLIGLKRFPTSKLILDLTCLDRIIELVKHSNSDYKIILILVIFAVWNALSEFGLQYSHNGFHDIDFTISLCCHQIKQQSNSQSIGETKDSS